LAPEVVLDVFSSFVSVVVMVLWCYSDVCCGIFMMLMWYFL